MPPNRHLIRLAREIRGMTQSTFSDKSGLDQGHISRIESGDQAITDESMSRLIEALEFPETFFNRDYEPMPMIHIQCKHGHIKIDGRLK